MAVSVLSVVSASWDSVGARSRCLQSMFTKALSSVPHFPRVLATIHWTGTSDVLSVHAAGRVQ